MWLHVVFLLLLILPGLNSQVAAQNNSATAPTLTEELTISINPPNEAFFVTFPTSIIGAQTALAVRYFLVISAAGHEVTAACDPVILSFFGTKDAIPKSFCNLDDIAIINAYFIHRVLVSQYPIEAAPYGRFLARLGLDPFSRSMNKDTKVGWANVFAERLVKYFNTDGWNAQGDVTRDDFLQQYSDSSGYKPQNPAFLPPLKLRRPLRWQPLTAEVDGKGNFASQVHVVPHLATKAKPLVLSPRGLRSKRVEAPYKTPNRKRSISAADEKTMLGLIDQLFKLSSNLDNKKVATAFWWENKFFSLGIFIPYYLNLLKIDDVMASRLFLGEMMAQHDGILLAWKEKVRHDLVRPPTMVRRLLKGKKVRAYRGFGKGVGLVKAEEWEPVVKVQPHSEFPSASSVLCKVSADHLELALHEISGNGTIPAFETTLAASGPLAIPNSPVDVPVKIRFDSLQEAALSCGESRLLSGVHFEPSVRAGFDLAQGVGEVAYRHMRDLYAGKIPKNCGRCIKN